MPQRALIKRILLAAAGSIILVVFHQFQGVIIEGVRGPLPRVILDTGCLPPPRRGPDAIALVASYFVPPAQPSPDWTEIAAITLENHRLAASKLGARYVRASSSERGAWCGKLREIHKLLGTIPRGSWLLFVDADAAFRCRANVTASLQGFSGRRASLVVGNRFGIFAARHDKYALGWLDRMARALETRPPA